MPMLGTEWLAPLAETSLIRRAADAVSLRIAHNRTAALDRMNAGQVQHNTLLRLVRHAPGHLARYGHRLTRPS